MGDVNGIDQLLQVRPGQASDSYQNGARQLRPPPAVSRPMRQNLTRQQTQQCSEGGVNH